MEHLYETLEAANQAPQSSWHDFSNSMLSYRFEGSRYVLVLAVIVMSVVVGFEAMI